MKKLRFYYWLVQSIFKKHFLVILIAALVGAITTTQSHLYLKYIPRPKPTYFIGRVGAYTLATLPQDIQLKVSSGLTNVDESGIPNPNLVTDWKIIDDGKSYVFTLKDDVSWQDGQLLKSSDINYSFQDVTIQTPDEKTVVFQLQERFAPFPGIVNQPIFKRITKSYLNLFSTTRIVGLGEYSITNIDLHGSNLSQITLNSSQAKIVYRFYNTEQAAVTAFKLGDVDYLQDMTNIYELTNWDQIGIQKHQSDYRYVAVFFNTTDPNLSQKPIRQALAYAIQDKEQGNQRAKSPISPASWAYNPKVKTYDYSLQDAQELLAEFKTDFEIELSTTPSFVDLAESIKTSWETLGISVKIKVSNFPNTENYQALLIGQQIPKDPDQYQLWHSTQATNITKYKSAKVDKLLEDGRTELDQTQRKIIYQDFQRFLLEDSPSIFLYFLQTTDVYRTKPLPNP